MLLLWRHGTLHGPFCATCAPALYQTVMAHNAWAGWWSPLSLLLNPLSLIGNEWSLRRILHRARRAGRPTVPVKPHPAWALAAVLTVVAGAVAVNVAEQADRSWQVGNCVQTGGISSVEPVSCSSADATGLIARRVSTEARCPASTDWYVRDGSEVLCLERL